MKERLAFHNAAHQKDELNFTLLGLFNKYARKLSPLLAPAAAVPLAATTEVTVQTAHADESVEKPSQKIEISPSSLNQEVIEFLENDLSYEETLLQELKTSSTTQTKPIDDRKKQALLKHYDSLLDLLLKPAPNRKGASVYEELVKTGVARFPVMRSGKCYEVIVRYNKEKFNMKQDQNDLKNLPPSLEIVTSTKEFNLNDLAKNIEKKKKMLAKLKAPKAETKPAPGAKGDISLNWQGDLNIYITPTQTPAPGEKPAPRKPSCLEQYPELVAVLDKMDFDDKNGLIPSPVLGEILKHKDKAYWDIPRYGYVYLSLETVGLEIKGYQKIIIPGTTTTDKVIVVNLIFIMQDENSEDMTLEIDNFPAGHSFINEARAFNEQETALGHKVNDEWLCEQLVWAKATHMNAGKISARVHLLQPKTSKEGKRHISQRTWEVPLSRPYVK